MKKCLFALVFLVIAVSVSKAEDMCLNPVSTSEGPVIGMADGGTCAYKGIPYAAPPVGDLRWKSPAAPQKRDKAFEAVEFGAECSQIEMAPGFLTMGKKPNRKEDCLYINIWRPKKSGTYPVMFWIHGGGLTSGTGGDPMYWGDRLAAKKDVVVVTFNYRLGALGFLAEKNLSAEDPHGSSGNYGMLDQVQALKWVKENIGNFGGDPNNVTIFGESAGGWSVCMQLASPLSAGLFQRAILESGGCDTTRTMEQGFADANKFAAALGCSGENIVSCLRSKSADQIVEATKSRKEASGDFLTLKMWDHVWSPHEDGWFLKETPIKSLRNGNYNKTPFMVGSNRDEARLFAAENKISYRKTKTWKVMTAIADALGKEFAPMFGKLYPFANYDRPIDAFVDAKGDIVLGCKCFDAAEATGAYPPTFYYRFDYDVNRAPHILGAAHAVEIPFIFDSLDRSFFKHLYGKSQRKQAQPLVEQVMSYWSNFAKSGDPNGQGLTQWPVYNTQSKQRMYLDLPIHVDATENVERCKFWNERSYLE